MRVRLNLATKPLETHRRFFVFSGATGALAFILCLALAWHVHSVRKADAAFRLQSDNALHRIDALTAEREELERFFSEPINDQLHDRATFVNTILDARSFNWTRMFMDLERILPGGVRVISIEPKQVAGHVELKLTVGATNDEAELKFEHALEQSREFTRVQIQDVRLSNAVGNQSGDQKVVQLTTV